MQLTIARKVGSLLAVLAGGSVAALAAFFWFLHKTAGEIDTLLVADDVYMHARMLHDLADRKVWDEGDRRYFKRIVPEVDRAIGALRKGGVANGRTVPPPPPETVELLERMGSAWARLSGPLAAALDSPLESPAAQLARKQMHPPAPELEEASQQLLPLLDARARLHRRWISGVLIVLSAVGLGVLAAGLWITRRSIVRPLRLVEEGLRRAEQGDFAHRVPVVGHDEGARLAAALNQMSARLADLIAEREHAATALRESREQLDLALRAADIGLWMWVPATGELYLSPRWKAQIGYEDHELPGRIGEFEARLHPEDRERVLNAIQGFLASPGKEYKQEFRLRHKDGSWRWMVSRASAIFDGEGKLVRVTGFHIDATEQRLLEEQLRQSQKMEAIGKLAGGVAHDFNNLLTVMAGYAQMIQAGLDPQNPLHDGAGEILVAAERARRLTAQLLAFSRRQVVQSQVVDLNQTVGGMDRMLRRLIGEDIMLQTRKAEHLGYVSVDPGQMEQVILNLAVNAREAMPDGGTLTLETANVELDVASAWQHLDCPPGRYVQLAVSDTGCGMDEQTRAHIFEPFFTTKERASGLGLATVHGIVRQSGGYIALDTIPGGGTTFRVYLPRVDLGVPRPVSEPKPGATPQGGRETILLVEDETALRQLVSQMLGQLGYSVLEADSAEAAIGVIDNRKVDLLLTDVVMPGKGGRELAQVLMALHPGLRVLYMSGYTDGVILNPDAPQPGAPLLAKPFTREMLAAKIREALG